MITFLKRQFFKIMSYIIILVLINILWLFNKWNVSVLISFNSLVTSIFTLVMSKTWIEDYKLEINKELEKYKTKLSSYTLVTKLQYDLEFKIYTEIYEKMFLLYIETAKLKPDWDIETTDEIILERVGKFGIIYDDVSNLINKYRPFYSRELYDILIQTRDFAYEESRSLQLSIAVNVRIVFDFVKSHERKENMKLNLDKLSELIRQRIENMKIVED